jgi:hypothetical protein
LTSPTRELLPATDSQIPCEEKTHGFSLCVGIIPCTRLCCPKPGLPPAETVAEKKVLLPNMPNKENDIETTDVV